MYEWHLSNLDKVEKKNIKVFTCFSCGGGSSMGYKLAGCEVIGNIEIDDKMNKLYVANHNPKFNYNMDIRDFIKLRKYPEELQDLDILDGSPPCSSFSIAGAREEKWGVEKKFREGQKMQTLDDLFFDFLDVVRRLKPKVVIAENVKGILQGNAKGYVNLIIARFQEIGYDLQIFLLDASTMGVPQKRERVFFIARRKELNLPPLCLRFQEKPIIFGQIFSNDYYKINRDTLQYKRWLKRKPEDNDIADTTKRTEFKKVSGFNMKYIKMHKVCPTITASNPHILYDYPGNICKKDLLNVQTFPQDYNFLDDNYSTINYVCGMSVPPLMIKKISEQVISQFGLGGENKNESVERIWNR